MKIHTLETIDVELFSQIITDLASLDRQDNLDGLKTLGEALEIDVVTPVLQIEQAVKLTINTIKLLQGITTRDVDALATRAAAHYRRMCNSP